MVIRNIARFFRRASAGVLNDLMGATETALEGVRKDIVELDIEYIISTSSGTWLEEWGDHFGVYRKLNETDAAYRGRIQAIATKPKNTIPAIISSVMSYIGNADEDVTVYEPFTNVRKFSVSKFSGPDKFPDATYYRTSVIDIRVSTSVTDGMKQVVNRIKSAGVRVYFTFTGELGPRQPIFMGTNVQPIVEYHRHVEILISKVASTDNTPVNLGMSYRDASLDVDVAFAEFEREVEISGYIYKTISAGSLLTINTLSGVVISDADRVPDDTTPSCDLVQEGGSHL